MKFFAGPINAQFILADEINRAPPKTQAALLEAMAERQFTVAGRTMKPSIPPFVVVATQNPIEQEGTYPVAGGGARPVSVQPVDGLPGQG